MVIFGTFVLGFHLQTLGGDVGVLWRMPQGLPDAGAPRAVLMRQLKPAMPGGPAPTGAAQDAASPDASPAKPEDAADPPPTTAAPSTVAVGHGQDFFRQLVEGKRNPPAP
eukprot:EG_transcript_33291